MKRKTAMMELIEKLKQFERDIQDKGTFNETWDVICDITVIAIQLLEKEKEQIMEAHYAPKYGCFSNDYYNETYKQLNDSKQ